MAAVISRLWACIGLVCVSACVPNDDKGRSDVKKEPAAPQRPNEPRIPGPVAFRSPDSSSPARALLSAVAAARDGGAREAARSPTTPESQPLLKRPFEDSFERSELGPDWQSTSEVWRVEGGRLCGSGAHNHPVWLTRRIPVNARIEFDATSSSPDGDIKAEFWGDGASAATATSYTNASSYLTIFGGWKNQYHVIARLDEHASNRMELRVQADSTDLRARPVAPNRTYRFKVERADAKNLRWFVDDIEVLSFSDPNPLKGRGHDHFGFNDWEVRLCFDNLKIMPLEGE